MDTLELLELLRQALPSDREVTITITIHPAPVSAHNEPGGVQATCPWCDWSRQYTSKMSAKRGLNGHLAHCAERNRAWIEQQQSANASRLPKG